MSEIDFCGGVGDNTTKMENTPHTPTTPPVDETPAEEVDVAPPQDDELDGETEEALEEEDNTPLLQWQTKEPVSPPRPHWWYVIMGLIAAAIIIIGIFTQVWIIIPLGILVPVALTMYGNKGPGDHSYSLEPLGIRVDQKNYGYNTFKAFFVVEQDGQTVFELIPLERLGALVTVHADSTVVDEVADILASVLPETEPQGYLGESIFKRLKF